MESKLGQRVKAQFLTITRYHFPKLELSEYSMHGYMCLNLLNGRILGAEESGVFIGLADNLHLYFPNCCLLLTDITV